MPVAASSLVNQPSLPPPHPTSAASPPLARPTPAASLTGLSLRRFGDCLWRTFLFSTRVGLWRPLIILSPLLKGPVIPSSSHRLRTGALPRVGPIAQAPANHRPNLSTAKSIGSKSNRTRQPSHSTGRPLSTSTPTSFSPCPSFARSNFTSGSSRCEPMLATTAMSPWPGRL